MPTKTRSATAISERAHRESVAESIQSITELLADLLGARLTAHVARVDPSTVSRWKSGDSTPQPDAEQRLRATHQVARLLLAVDDSDTVRAWFIGMNPQLDDETPADVIAEGEFKAVLAAARSFVSTA
jgi:hypothetical protein